MKKFLCLCCLFAFFLTLVQPATAEENIPNIATGAFVASSPASLNTITVALGKASQENKFVFLLVRDKQDEAIAAVKKTVEATVQKVADKAIALELDRNLPAEKETVEKYGLLRAPMPLVLVIAPNGAVTLGMVGDKATSEKLEAALVSQGLQRLIKAMQDRKLVLLCVQNANTKSNDAAMQGAKDFKADPRFGNDVEIIQVDPADANEEKLFSQLKIDPKTTEAVTTLLAPPGAAIGTFSGPTTKEKIEAALISATSGGCGSGCASSGCGN